MMKMIGGISMDLSPAALESLDEEPVNIERFNKTIEYLPPIAENKRQHKRTEDPTIEELLQT